MRFIVTISMENAAFGEDCGSEVARILRKLASACASGEYSLPDTSAVATLLDVNGNKVGSARVEE